MKKVSIAAVFLTLVLSLSGCLNDDGANFYYTTLPISSAVTPDTLVYNKTDSITIRYSIPGACHEFIGIDFSNDTQTGDTIQRRTFWAVAQAQTGEECEGAQSVTREHKFAIEVRYKQPYQLRFITGRDSEGEYTFITRDIPVKEEE